MSTHAEIIDELTDATDKLVQTAVNLVLADVSSDGQARLNRDIAQRNLNGIIERAGSIQATLMKLVARESLREKQLMFEKIARKSDHDLCFTTNIDGEYTFKDTSKMFDAFLWGLTEGED